MPRQTRRVVTGHDAHGRAIVVQDANAPNVRVRSAGNVTSTLLWVSDETPANLDIEGDPSLRELGVAPPPGGSILRIVDFPPEAEAGGFDNAAMLREMGLSADATGGGSRHAATHRTRSIDYAIVLEGEIDMLLDDSEVHLTAGDVLIQRATNHAWVNRGGETCRVAFVLIDAIEPNIWKRPAHG